MSKLFSDLSAILWEPISFTHSNHLINNTLFWQPKRLEKEFQERSIGSFTSQDTCACSNHVNWPYRCRLTVYESDNQLCCHLFQSSPVGYYTNLIFSIYSFFSTWYNCSTKTVISISMTLNACLSRVHCGRILLLCGKVLTFSCTLRSVC